MLHQRPGKMFLHSDLVFALACFMFRGKIFVGKQTLTTDDYAVDDFK